MRIKKRKNKSDSIILLKTSKMAIREKAEENRRLEIERVCPCCGYDDNFSAIVQDTYPQRMVYTCDKCGAEWLGLPIR